MHYTVSICIYAFTHEWVCYCGAILVLLWCYFGAVTVCAEVSLITMHPQHRPLWGRLEVYFKSPFFTLSCVSQWLCVSGERRLFIGAQTTLCDASSCQLWSPLQVVISSNGIWLPSSLGPPAPSTTTSTFTYSTGTGRVHLGRPSTRKHWSQPQCVMTPSISTSSPRPLFSVYWKGCLPVSFAVPLREMDILHLFPFQEEGQLLCMLAKTPSHTHRSGHLLYQLPNRNCLLKSCIMIEKWIAPAFT